MLKVKAAKYLALCSVFSTGMHFTANGWVKVENYLSDQFERTANAMVLDLGNTFGLEPRKSPEPEYDLVEFASLTAVDNDVNPAVIRGMMHTESRNKEFAISPKGAIGPMQIMPATAKWCGLKHLGKAYDEKENIKCGVRYFKHLLDGQLKRKVKYPLINALREYNGGYNCVPGGCSESEQYWKDVLIHVSLDKGLV